MNISFQHRLVFLILVAGCIAFLLFHQQDRFLPINTGVLVLRECGILGNPKLAQDDADLISYIRNYHLTPPSNKPYSLDAFQDPKKNPSEYGGDLMKLFKLKRNGFFIEAGANDGEFRSNTLQLEREYNWTGLLIEPNPFMLTKLRLRNRRAWVAGICLALQGYPEKIRFMHRVGDKAYMNGMGIIEHSPDNPVPPATKRNPNNYVYAGPVDCFPLYSILLAVNQTVVDYFSLDIEGIEFRVLKAIPFELVTIKVISIEYNLIPEGEKAVRSFLESKGYVIIFKKHVELFAVLKEFAHEFGLDLEKTS